MMEVKAISWGSYEHKIMASSLTTAKAQVPRKQFHVQVPEALSFQSSKGNSLALLVFMA